MWMKDNQQQRNMLTVTYFVDPQRKRQFQISLPGLRLVMLFGVLFAGASLASLLWLSFNINSKPSSTEMLDTMAASINAGPETATTLLAATAARSGIEAGAIASVTSPSDAPKDNSDAKAKRPVEFKRLSTTDPKALSETIGISTPSFHYQGEGLETVFAVINHGSQAAQGTVWGVATFESESGKTLAVPSHANLDLSALDDMRAVEQGTPYKAKNLTNKSLSFAPPPNQSGQFTEVRIAISELGRAQLVVATFALNSR